ncbi:flavin reductase family protein [Terrarubrum flagellatum]|uniref:flavin reductase family protein n=1 Tax=Terrirubrum flagellatum TaxID=2895980 RepID=UPI003144E3BC
MRNVAGAVSIVTASVDGRCAGLTATSLTALSADPPTIIVCVNRAASAWPTIQRAGRFAINVLAARHQSIADRFAGRGGHKGEERFAEGDWTTLITGAPILQGTLATLDCEIEEAIDRHSHTILIGRVKAIQASQEEGALLYWRGLYGTFDDDFQNGAGI